MPSYAGGKGQAGIYQQIICQFPPHAVYIEPFLGGGSIMRYKKPAARSIGIDLDPAAIAALSDDRWGEVRPGSHAVSADGTRSSIEVICTDALAFLRDYTWQGTELVYCDPPYLLETRSSKRPIYACEFGSSEQHSALLELLSSIPAMVAISGYWSSLYATMLQSWRTISFPAVRRSGKLATEWLWMNYPEPQALHDYQFLGNGFRERERIQRKIKRWSHRIEKMPRLERLAMLAALEHRQNER